MSQTKTEPNTSAKPTKLRGSRLVAAIVVTLLVFAGTMSMALVAISVQTGYFRAGLPPQIQRVELLLIGHTVEVATYAPLALEVGQWLLTLMVVVLVFCRLPYARWHRAMWTIGLSVAVVNGWHIYEITNSISIGASFGAFSILGPLLVHLYVMFMRQLIAGTTVTEALGETTSGLIKAVRFILGAVLHPIRSMAYVSRWSMPPLTPERQLRQDERQLELELASRLRRHALISAARQQSLTRSASTPGLLVRLLARVPWINAHFEIRRPTGPVLIGLEAKTLTRKHAAESTAASSAGNIRTTLPPVPDSQSEEAPAPMTGALHDGAHRTQETVREGVPHDVAVRTFSAALQDDVRLHDEIDQLARRFGVSGTPSVRDTVQDDTVSHSPAVRDERAATVQPDPTVQADRATERATERANERASGLNSSDASVRADLHAAQAVPHDGVRPHAQEGVQSVRATRANVDGSVQLERAAHRATHDEPTVQAVDSVRHERAKPAGEKRAEERPHTASAEQESVQEASHGDRAARPQTDHGVRHDEPDSPEDTGSITKKSFIVEHYYRLLDSGIDVAGVNRADVARDLKKLAPTLDASTVRRYWNQCLRGECPRPSDIAASGAMTAAGVGSLEP